MTIRKFAVWSAAVGAVLILSIIAIFIVTPFVSYQSPARVATSDADLPALNQESHSDGQFPQVTPLRAMSAALDQSGSDSDKNIQRTSNGPTQSDSQGDDFDQRARQIALLYRSATTQEVREKLIRDLSELNDRHFEDRQQQRTQEIERLSARVESLRQSQKRREQNKPEILKRRLNELLNPDANLNWDDAEKKGSPEASRNPASLALQHNSEPGAQDGLAAHGQRPGQPKSDPKFEGTTLSEWLEVLKTERSLAKINSALIAIRFLAAEADPKLVVSTITRMAQSQSKLKDGQIGVDITPQITEVFYELPADVAVNALLEQLRQLPPRVPSKGLKRLVSSLFGAINNSATCRTEYCEVYIYSSGHESAEISFRRAILQRSRQLIQTLAQIAQNDHSEDDWVVETSLYILEVSEQILSNYPELIPVVKRDFTAFRLAQLQEVSAGLLCESGIDSDQVVEFFRARLLQRRRQCKMDHYDDYQFLVNQIVKGARSSNQLVDLLAEELVRCYAAGADENFANLGVKQILITGLGRVGNMARNKLPLLEEAEANESSTKLIQIYDKRLFAIKQENPNFKDLIADVIQQIQESKPKPKPQPFPDDSPSLTRSIDRFSGERTADPVNVTPKNETSKTESNPLVEKTFDGVPYSQWLKMLESERKPEKLAMSIDACSRLAEHRDEHRIARGIFRAAGLIEKGDPAEQMLVWNAAQAALARLPAEVAVDELIEALRDETSYRSGREFQGNDLLQTTLRSNKPIQARADELINLVMKRIRDGGKGTGELFAAASEVWARSDRPLSDFPELNTMVLDAVQEGPIADSSNPDLVAYDMVPHPWRRAMFNLIEKNPETPDLALSLVKHAGKSHEVVELIGLLGRRAEPAVPQLVEHFLTEWKPLELKRRDEIDWKELPRVARISPEEERRHVVRCQAVIDALGRIGSGPKGYALLRQLKLISPYWVRFSDGDWNEQLDSAWQKMASYPESPENLLSDFTLIRGHWTLRSQSPAKKHPSSSAKIDYTWFELGEEEQNNFSPDGTDIFNFAGWWPSWRYEIDESKNPKQISIFRVDSRNRGPTAVKETTLRIQFAKVGEKAPSEIVMDESQLPEGDILLKFDRTLKPPKPTAGE